MNESVNLISPSSIEIFKLRLFNSFIFVISATFKSKFALKFLLLRISDSNISIKIDYYQIHVLNLIHHNLKLLKDKKV